MKITSSTQLVFLGIILAIAIRILLTSCYTPLYGNDSPSYAALAKMIEAHSFDGYDGRRTPGYPLFMLLTRYNNETIRIIQYVLGIISIYLTFMIMRLALPARYCWPFILLMGISIQFAFYESIIQTEGLALFSVVLSLYLFLRPSKYIYYNLSMAGFVASLGALIRAHLVILVPIYIICALVTHKLLKRSMIVSTLSLALPFLLLVGGWSAFNYHKLQRLTFTTLPKADLIAHMIHYIEDADPKYGEVAQAFKEAYAIQREFVEIADDNRAFYASYAGRLLRERGHTNQLENAAMKHAMAMDLVRKHPIAYVNQCFSAWARFWRVHIIIYSECFENSSLYALFTKLWLPIKVMWLLLNIIFIAMIPFVYFLNLPDAQKTMLFTVYLLLLGASVSQAITQYYDNARFAIPFQPLAGIAISILAAHFIEKRKSKRNNITI